MLSYIANSIGQPGSFSSTSMGKEKMIITLTNQLDNPVHVNWDNVELQQICNLNEKCNFTEPNDRASIDNRPAVRLHFVSGGSLIVQECLSDIRKKIITNKFDPNK